MKKIVSQNLKHHRNFSLNTIKEKLYNIKIFFKWITFHAKKYGQEIVDEHTACLPDPPDFVEPKPLTPMEYINGVLIPAVKFTWKHKRNSFAMMEQFYLETRTPEKMAELRKQGYESSYLEEEYGFNYEKELEAKKAEKDEEFEDKYLEVQQKQQEMLSVVKSKLDKSQNKNENESKPKDSSSKPAEYLRFASELFFKVLRQFIIGYHEGIGREYKPEKFDNFREKIFDEQAWLERIKIIANRAGKLKNELQETTKVDEKDLK